MKLVTVKKKKAKGNFRKKYDYEVFNWAFCMECVYYRQDTKGKAYGSCLRMEKEGVFPGVMAQATCNAFLSCKGTDIEGAKIPPAEFPNHVLVQVFKDKSIHLWRADLGQEGLETYGGKQFLDGVGVYA